jgi:predicted nucleotidyltransferase
VIDFKRLLAALIHRRVEFVVVGGVAATLHGSARLTLDLDIVYARSKENIRRMVNALAPLAPYLRGAPRGLPFHLDAETVRSDLNFTLTTDAGPLDLLGEIAGGFNYEILRKRSMAVELFGMRCRVITLEALIESKIAAGRPKDLEVIAELEAIREEASS